MSRPGRSTGTVREATPDDLDAIARSERDNLGVDAWSRGLVESGLPTASGPDAVTRYLVAELADEVVGHAVVSAVAGTAELQRIAVDRAQRRTGIATALLEAAQDVARAAGADRLLLEVRDENAGARAFYERHGFVEVGRRRRYYADGATAVVLSLALGRRDGAVGG